MISGSELTAWLGDDARHQATEDAAAKLAERWRAHPLMTDLEAELAAMPVKTAPAVLAAAERFMARVDQIGELVREMLRGAAADPFFRPPFLPITSEISGGFLLFGDPSLTIALCVTNLDSLAAKKTANTGATSIIFTGLLTRFAWLKSGNATMSLWEADPIRPDFVASEVGRCRFAGRRTISDGESLLMDGARESFVIDHANSDMIFLQAVVHADCAPLRVEYDSASHEFVAASSADEASSRVQMMVSLLRVLGRDEAVPEILGLLDSPHFFTRWHVMREFLAMNADAALPRLEQMAASDPHAEVRAAATRTLDMFFADKEAA